MSYGHVFFFPLCTPALLVSLFSRFKAGLHAWVEVLWLTAVRKKARPRPLRSITLSEVNKRFCQKQSSDAKSGR